DEIDRVMREGLPSQNAMDYHGIRFQYVPMMTAETRVSLSLLDSAGALLATLLRASFLPTRATRVGYIGDTPWHTDSELPIHSIGCIAYFDSLNAENGALRNPRLTLPRIPGCYPSTRSCGGDDERSTVTRHRN